MEHPNAGSGGNADAGQPAPAEPPATPLHEKDLEWKQRSVEQGLFLGPEQAGLIVEQTHDLACLLDLHGRFLYANPAFESVLGQPPLELVGRNYFDLAQSEDRPALQALFEEARFLHELRQADVRYLHRDGRPFIFESAVSFVFGANGTPRCALVVSREVQGRKGGEEESRLLAAFPRNSPNPVLAFSAEGALIYFNEAAQAMARALQREHPKDILPLNIAAVVRMCLVSSDGSLRLENTISGRTLSWSFFPVRDRKVVHCYAEEITERIELETKLRQSQKMQSVGQLAAGVAHDFNNILTIIKGHTSLLLEGVTQGPGLAKSIQEIATATERAVSLTRQLLMFSRKQLAQRQLMDLNEAIKESSGMLKVLMGEPIRLHVERGANLPAIYADPSMIQQVLINLAANARDAMPKGGDLLVSSALLEVSEAGAGRLPDARPGRFVCLSVSDTGCGIDAKIQERIFEPFFTTKEPGKGTGLGLATVYGIAKQHHGWVELSSEPGHGATFKVFFPAVSKALENEAEFSRKRVAGGSETILVVEDEAPLRELVLEILQQYGYQTIEASNGLRALELWEKKREAIDLVLTDVMMPEGISGRDLAEHILADNPKMRIIYTSGYPMDVLGRDFFQNEGTTFLQKPYHPQTLAKLIRQRLDAPA